ncbi:MAG: CotH kinase family protein [Myxococcales bacterium]|nr:CotH kinase family protein [Myxococcales bacterium]
MRGPAAHLPLTALLVLAACGDDTTVTSATTGSTGDATSTGSSGAATSTSTSSTGSTGSSGADTSTSSTGADTSSGATTTPETSTTSTGADTTTTGVGTDGTDTDATTGTTGEPVDPYLDAEPLFNTKAIADINITLSDNALLALNTDPKKYTVGGVTATIGGQVYDLPQVGVRLKGNYGSFRKLDKKAAFLLDFNRYVPGQDLLGIEKLAVNNMVQDCSAQREILGYTLFRDAGVAAPRAAYATVSVNGELYGLYTTVEAVDNDVFLNHWFGSDKGQLYEGAYGSDLVADKITSFDLDNGSDMGFADLFVWLAALDAMQDPATFLLDAAAVMDIDNVTKSFATGIYLGDWDGYAWTRNNFFVYNRPSDQRWVFLPWGIDQTLRQHLGTFGGQGRVQQMCAASVPCRMLLADHYSDVVARVDNLDLIGMANDLQALSAAAFAADPRKECGIAAHNQEVVDNINFFLNRKNTIAEGLKCTVPSAVDNDKDGYSACIDDCNDNDPNVHPGAPEVCDLDDDNCDGIWDEDPKCPHCVNKDIPGPGTADFCFVALPFDQANTECKAKGGELVSIHDQATQDWLVQEAFAIASADWWIGLSDIQQEGTFVWSDGTPLDFTAWNEGEPNNSGNEDCVNLPKWSGGLWNDLKCSTVRPYICKLP